MKKRLPTVNELKELSDILYSEEVPQDAVEDLMDEGLFVVAEEYPMTNDLIGIEGVSYVQIRNFAKVMIAVWNLKSLEIYRWTDGKLLLLEGKEKKEEK